MFQDLTESTLALLQQSRNGNLARGFALNAQDQRLIQKAGITVGTGLVGYSLEAPAKLAYPVLTPFRNMIPRVGGGANGMQSTAENWKIITALNPGNVRAGVSEGHRGGVLSVSETDVTAPYSGIGLENSVSFEATYASEGFEDTRALAVLMDLQALMVQEEAMIVNGNRGLALGTTPTPTATASASGGTLGASTTTFLYCVALTWWGVQYAVGLTGGAQNPVPSTGILSPTQTRTNADASSDTFGNGVGRISAASSAITTTGTTASITGTVTPVKGAFGYAWFLGTSAGAANAFLVAVTNVPTVVITATATSTYAANSTGLSSDNSTCSLDFDGLITLALRFNGYYNDLRGATLTADGSGGIVEIDVMLKYMWDVYRISPTALWVDSQCARDITKKVASGTTNPTFRVNLQPTAGSMGNLIAGSLVTSYLNKYGLAGVQELPIKLHPNLPTGTIYISMDKNPYPNTRTAVPYRIRTRREYYQIEWPLKTRQYEYGVYADEMLQLYFGFATGIITGIAAG